jgi:hypothetical protein
MGTVSVTTRGPTRYVVSFSRLPGRTFGPWNAAETIRDLTVSALLSAEVARSLVHDARANGTSCTEVA